MTLKIVGLPHFATTVLLGVQVGLLSCATVDQPASLAARADLALLSLSFDGLVLDGEVANKTRGCLAEAWLEVVFHQGEDGTPTSQLFRVVPGGDGQGLRPGYSKHFKYRVRLDRWVPNSSTSGTLVREKWTECRT